MNKNVMQMDSKLSLLEEKRRKVWQKFKGLMLFEALVLFLIYWYFYAGNTPLPYVFLSVGVLLLSTIVYLSIQYSRIKKTYKSGFVEPMLQSTYVGWQYKPKAYIPIGDFKQSRLFSYFNRYNGDDLIIGQVDDRSFQLSEVCAKFHSSSGKSSTTRIIFSGLFLMSDIDNEHIDFVLEPDRMERLMGKWISKLTRNQTNIGELLRLGNDDFDGNFRLRTNSLYKTETYFQPSLISYLLNMNAKLQNGQFPKSGDGFRKDVWLSVQNGQLFLAFGGVKLFTVPFFKSVDYHVKHFTENVRIIQLITQSAQDLQNMLKA